MSKAISALLQSGSIARTKAQGRARYEYACSVCVERLVFETHEVPKTLNASCTRCFRNREDELRLFHHFLHPGFPFVNINFFSPGFPSEGTTHWCLESNLEGIAWVVFEHGQDGCLPVNDNVRVQIDARHDKLYRALFAVLKESLVFLV